MARMPIVDVENLQTKVFLDGKCGNTGGDDRYGSITSREALMVVPVDGQEQARDSPVVSQSSDSSMDQKTPKCGEKYLKIVGRKLCLMWTIQIWPHGRSER